MSSFNWPSLPNQNDIFIGPIEFTSASNGTTTINGRSITGANVPIVYNVKAYGALGDGATDDTAAFQAAISAAETNLGSVVYVPASRNQYLISSTLVINSQVVFSGDASFCSTLGWTGGASPMIQLTIAANAPEVCNLSLFNAGTATVGIQINSVNAKIYRVDTLTVTGFSTAVFSTFQASSYTYHTIIRDCNLLMNGTDSTGVCGILAGGGHTLIVDGCMISGFVNGIKLESAGGGQTLLGASITNTHIESFNGTDGPGSPTAIGINASVLYGLNVSGCNFQMNALGSVSGQAQRAITLDQCNGANISGCEFFGTGHGYAVSFATGNPQGILINGNQFYNMDGAIEFISLNGTYEIGLNQYTSITVPYVDSWTPVFTGLTVVLGGGSVVYAGRFQRIGPKVFVTITITPSGGATTACAVGTTFVGLDGSNTGLPDATMRSTCVAIDAVSNASLGIGLILTNGTLYPPGWAATSDQIVITGDFIVT